MSPLEGKSMQAVWKASWQYTLSIVSVDTPLSDTYSVKVL